MNTSSRQAQQTIATFMASALTQLSDVKGATAVVVGVPVAPILGKTGSSTEAARAIREASLSILQGYTASASHTVIDLENGQRTQLRSPLACIDLGDLRVDASRDNCLATDLDKLAKQIRAAGAVPVFIGGERADFAALLDQIAAHDSAALLLVSHDLALPTSTKGLPVAAIGVNGLQDQAHWSRVAKFGTIVTADQVHDDGIRSAVDAIDAFIAAHQSVFCLIDMAVLDTGHAAGTSDANIGGLTPEQLVGIFAALNLSSPLAAVALSNVAPQLDLRAQTEFVAAQVLVTVLAPYLVRVAV